MTIKYWFTCIRWRREYTEEMRSPWSPHDTSWGWCKGIPFCVSASIDSPLKYLCQMWFVCLRKRVNPNSSHPQRQTELFLLTFIIEDMSRSSSSNDPDSPQLPKDTTTEKGTFNLKGPSLLSLNLKSHPASLNVVPQLKWGLPYPHPLSIKSPEDRDNRWSIDIIIHVLA